VPALAFSLLGREKYNFDRAAQIAATLVKKALDEGIPPATLLNVNVPSRGEIKGIKITKQGFKNAKPVISEHTDPRGKFYYWIGEERIGFHAYEGTDFEAIDMGFVSVTPIRADMTNHAAIAELSQWDTLSL